MGKHFKPYRKDAVLLPNGEWVKVSEEVAKVINNDNWRLDAVKRSQKKPIVGRNQDSSVKDFDEKASSRECSFEQLLENGGEPYLGGTASFEDDILDQIDRSDRIGIINLLLPSLSEEEKRILFAVSVNMSSRSYEKEYGTPRRTFDYRKKKLLKQLRAMVEEKESELTRVRVTNYRTLER